MKKNLDVAYGLIGECSDQFRDYVESSVMTDREMKFADAIQILLEVSERLILELQDKVL